MKESVFLIAISLLLFGEMEAQSAYTLGEAVEPKPAIEITDSLAVQMPLSEGGLTPSPKTNRRIPQRGINIGISQQEIFFTSLNVGYLSGQKIGFDASVRTIVPKRIAATVFVGLVYQIDDSRFLAKFGMEYATSINDDYHGKTDFFVWYVGGKYLLPFSEIIGLQVEAGLYFGNELVLPAFGIGIIFCPFGP